jgi:AAA family ATP:ADP antiporter
MALMNIFIIFNFWLVHNLKDTLIVASPESGAEAISFIKMWAVFPVSLVFVMIYTWLSNCLKQRTLFYGIVSFFIAFFALFTFVLYPNVSSLHMSSETILQLKAAHPHLKWFFPALGYWTYTLFYVMAEMWAAVVLTLLFWQFANQITSVEEAKRFYMMFGTFSAFGILSSGILTHYVTKTSVSWESTLTKMMSMTIVNGFIILALYWWINKYVVKDKDRYHPALGKADSKHTLELSLFDSFKHIFKSSYLGYIALIAIGYNLSINIIEITWKSQLKLIYANEKSFNGFMGDFNVLLSLVTFVTGIIGANVVRKFNWYTSAMVTPVVMLVMGSLFFVLTIFGDTCFSYIAIGVSPILVASWLGLIQNLLARSSKFCFFNATREMAYIPLDAELKVKGKAAVDVLSGRIGKLGGAAIQQVLLISIGTSQLMIAPYLAVILIGVIFIWMMGVGSLNKQFMALIKK